MPERNGCSVPSAERWPSGKMMHGVAAVERAACMLEAAPKASEARQREDVEEYRDQPVRDGQKRVEERVGRAAATAEVQQHLAGHGDGDAMAQV